MWTSERRLGDPPLSSWCFPSDTSGPTVEKLSLACEIAAELLLWDQTKLSGCFNQRVTPGFDFKICQGKYLESSSPKKSKVLISSYRLKWSAEGSVARVSKCVAEPHDRNQHRGHFSLVERFYAVGVTYRRCWARMWFLMCSGKKAKRLNKETVLHIPQFRCLSTSPLASVCRFFPIPADAS